MGLSSAQRISLLYAQRVSLYARRVSLHHATCLAPPLHATRLASSCVIVSLLRPSNLLYTICRFNLESNDKTFRSMMNLFLKMKDIRLNLSTGFRSRSTTKRTTDKPQILSSPSTSLIFSGQLTSIRPDRPREERAQPTRAPPDLGPLENLTLASSSGEILRPEMVCMA
ncbi:unnamed protein product [Sphenostylis stenocarpa]|uniref:Uncharacterized protein n=1 Tax=Sphenostylis stenocarpa TaxID=92480 RepID=A0AA86VQL1_9FABA|nr:unnamed protein product [Sphenostylis stenocarpa]